MECCRFVCIDRIDFELLPRDLHSVFSMYIYVEIFQLKFYESLNHFLINLNVSILSCSLSDPPEKLNDGTVCPISTSGWDLVKRSDLIILDERASIARRRFYLFVILAG